MPKFKYVTIDRDGTIRTHGTKPAAPRGQVTWSVSGQPIDDFAYSAPFRNWYSLVEKLPADATRAECLAAAQRLKLTAWCELSLADERAMGAA
jgi:hypothetical protein